MTGHLCDNEEFLAAYIDGTLPENSRVLYESHMSGCARCLSEMIAAKSEYDILVEEQTVIDARHREMREPAWTERLRTVFAPRGRLATAYALAASVVLTTVFIKLSVSPGWDFNLRSARSEIGSILSTSEIGELRLSGGRPIPPDRQVRVRGGSVEADLLTEAENSLRGSSSKHPDDAESRILLGHIYIIRNRPAMARLLYRQALEIDPGNMNAANDLAVAMYRTGDLEGARRQLESILEESRGIPEVYYNLSLVLHESGDKIGSIKYLHEYMLEESDSPWSERLFDLLDTETE